MTVTAPQIIGWRELSSTNVALKNELSDPEARKNTFCFVVQHWPSSTEIYELELVELDQGLGKERGKPRETGEDVLIATFKAYRVLADAAPLVMFVNESEAKEGPLKLSVAFFLAKPRTSPSKFPLMKLIDDIVVPAEALENELGAPELAVRVKGQPLPKSPRYCPWALGEWRWGRRKAEKGYRVLPKEGVGYVHRPGYDSNRYAREQLIELLVGVTRRTIEVLRTKEKQQALLEKARARAKERTGKASWLDGRDLDPNPDLRVIIHDLSHYKAVPKGKATGHATHHQGGSADVGFFYWVPVGAKKARLVNEFYSNKRLRQSSRILNAWKPRSHKWQAKKGSVAWKHVSHIDHAVLHDLHRSGKDLERTNASLRAARKRKKLKPKPDLEYIPNLTWAEEANWSFCLNLLEAPEVVVGKILMDPVYCALLELRWKHLKEEAGRKQTRWGVTKLQAIQWHDNHFHVDLDG